MTILDVGEIEALYKYHKQRARTWYATVEAMVVYADRSLDLLDEMLGCGLISEVVFARLQDAIMDTKSPGEAEET